MYMFWCVYIRDPRTLWEKIVLIFRYFSSTLVTYDKYK